MHQFWHMRQIWPIGILRAKKKQYAPEPKDSPPDPRDHPDPPDPRNPSNPQGPSDPPDPRYPEDPPDPPESPYPQSAGISGSAVIPGSA